jgi:hypothetical protein
VFYSGSSANFRNVLIWGLCFWFRSIALDMTLLFRLSIGLPFESKATSVNYTFCLCLILKGNGFGSSLPASSSFAYFCLFIISLNLSLIFSQTNYSKDICFSFSGTTSILGAIYFKFPEKYIDRLLKLSVLVLVFEFRGNIGDSAISVVSCWIGIIIARDGVYLLIFLIIMVRLLAIESDAHLSIFVGTGSSYASITSEISKFN